MMRNVMVSVISKAPLMVPSSPASTTIVPQCVTTSVVLRSSHNSCSVLSQFGSHMSEHSSAKITDAKEKHLKGESEAVIPGTEGWSQTLASASEAVVKAEQSPDLPMEELQRMSVEVMKQVRHEVHTTKTGPDVSSMPAMKDNMAHTRNAPEARGHAGAEGAQ